MKERKQIIVELFNDGKWWCMKGPDCSGMGACGGHDTFYDWADAIQKLYVPMTEAESRVAETPVTEGRCGCGPCHRNILQSRGNYLLHECECGSCRVAGGKSGEEIALETIYAKLEAIVTISEDKGSRILAREALEALRKLRDK